MFADLTRMTASKLGLMQALVVGKQMQVRFGEDLGLASGKKQDRRMPSFVRPLKTYWRKMSDGAGRSDWLVLVLMQVYRLLGSH